MPRIPWNPRNYSYGAGSNYGPVALNLLRTGKGYIGCDGLVHRYDENKESDDESDNKTCDETDDE